MNIPSSTLPHGDEYIAIAGNTSNPEKALVLLHGRGASADSIMHLTDQLTLPDNYLVLVPQAAEHVWYPERFIVPQSDNQPYLDSALDRINSIIGFLKTEHNVSPENITLAGFSQGACLVSEYLKRYPKKYQGVAIFSGGLIGSNDEVRANSVGNLSQTPIYIGCDVEDFHIPKERVVATAEFLTAMGATVDLQLYQGLGHTIHPEGLATLQGLMKS